MDLGRAFKGVFSGREKHRGTAINLPPVSPVATTVTQAPSRLTNQDRLARIGRYLEARNARDVCIGELEAGYLLVYGRATTQTVATLTFAQVAALPMAAEPAPPASLARQLTAIGRYLDRNLALSVFIYQQLAGYYVEYAAPPASAHTAAHLSRVSHFLDADAMGKLMMPTGMLSGGRT